MESGDYRSSISRRLVPSHVFDDINDENAYLESNQLDETDLSTASSTIPSRRRQRARDESSSHAVSPISATPQSTTSPHSGLEATASNANGEIPSASSSYVRPTARRPKRLVLSVDYGTTFTGLASAYTDSEAAELDKIEVLQDWTPRMSNQQKVASVISYEASSKEREAQWGSDISANTSTMANTKLHLQPPATRREELELTLEILRKVGNLSFKHVRRIGSSPAYAGQTPDQVIADYLGKIFQSACNNIDINQLATTRTPVDIVITVPVDWPHKAYDSIFQAFRNAGFNNQRIPTLQDTIMVTEPEAASHFTARDLLQTMGDFLKINDCFILCDAGGGTVDVISFQVKNTRPLLELEKVTNPTGAQYGSSFINTQFKIWLRSQIGADYGSIDPVNGGQARISSFTTETSAMRELMRRFNTKKHGFSMRDQDDIKIDLPEPLNGLTIPERVNQGELLIYWDEMKELMDICVDGVVQLIEAQMSETESNCGRPIKNLLLVGGFGASPYLQEQLQESLEMRDIKLRRPDANKSLTAIVKGGVIYGIEKSLHNDASYMLGMSKSYGICLDDKFQWLLPKASLVLSNKERVEETQEFFYPATYSNDGKCEWIVYRHPRQGGDEDEKAPKKWSNGKHEVEQACTVDCNVSKFLNKDLQPYQAYLSRPFLSPQSVGPLKIRFKVTRDFLTVEVLLKNNIVGSGGIRLDKDRTLSRRRPS